MRTSAHRFVTRSVWPGCLCCRQKSGRAILPSAASPNDGRFMHPMWAWATRARTRVRTQTQTETETETEIQTFMGLPMRAGTWD